MCSGEEAPQATSPEHSTKEVLVAAVVHGAIFAGVKDAVDRAGAKGFKKITGVELWDVGRGCLPASRVRRLLPHEAVSGCSAGQSGNRRRRRTALG